MAIFVEGRAELEFDKKLIMEIARATHPITIKACRRPGQGHVGQVAEEIWIQHTASASESTHFFLLWNCVGDSTVKSRMVSEYPYLVRRGYSRILCHRDLGPSVSYSDLSRFERELPYRVKTDPISPVFVLSVMGIEAWFLAEHTHFERIDPSLNASAISSALGFDPSTDDMQLRQDPAVDLDNCYALAQQTYNKLNTQPTIDALDCVSVYLDVADRFKHLRTLCREIEDFLAIPAASAA